MQFLRLPGLALAMLLELAGGFLTLGFAATHDHLQGQTKAWDSPLIKPPKKAKHNLPRKGTLGMIILHFFGGS